MQCSGCVVFFGAFRDRLVQLFMYITRDRQTYYARTSEETGALGRVRPEGPPVIIMVSHVAGP